MFTWHKSVFVCALLWVCTCMKYMCVYAYNRVWVCMCVYVCGCVLLVFLASVAVFISLLFILFDSVHCKCKTNFLVNLYWDNNYSDSDCGVRSPSKQSSLHVFTEHRVQYPSHHAPHHRLAVPHAQLRQCCYHFLSFLPVQYMIRLHC